MRKIRLHARAESDLIDIWVYSFEEWNDLQADKYLDKLNTAINSLANNPRIGRPARQCARGIPGLVRQPPCHLLQADTVNGRNRACTPRADGPGETSRCVTIFVLTESQKTLAHPAHGGEHHC